VIQIVSFSGSFTDSCEDGITTVSFGDVVDQFLDDDSLADTSTTEQTDLTTSGIGSKHINDFDTSDKDFST
jgi:hypothetical protein